MKYDVFISYRRQGGYDTAKHLSDLLARDGYKVSFDIDTLRSGNFDTQLLDRIDRCKDFILIVDEHAFDRTLDESFDRQKDWMRNELAYALRKEKNIIPVFLSGVNGFPNNLPDDIIGVTKKNGPEYNRYYFNDFYRELKRRFLHKPYQHKSVGIIIGVIAALLLFSWVFFFNTGHSQSNGEGASPNVEIGEAGEAIDTFKYYIGKFDDSKLFIKGLKRGIIYDTKMDENNKGARYTYKCGRVFTIQVIFYQTNMAFFCEDEGEQVTGLGYDFDDIGYEEYSEDENSLNFEYSGNRYVIGQYDIDGDDIDELIISVQTTVDWIKYSKGTGIGINVFKLINGGWERIAKLNTSSNIQPCIAKIINNMIYVPWLRYDERYIFQKDTIVYDTECFNRVFKASDFENKQ